MRRTVRSPLFLMALTVFIDFAGFGLVIPLLPFWAERLGANSVGVGMVLTAYALAQFLCTPLLGTLSDRYGRRPVILLSLLIEALAFAFTALAGSLPVLLVARFVGGVGASNIGSAQAVVADVTPPEGRARGMGLIGAAIGLGFVVGPAVGGALAPLGETVPFWVAMGVALVNALLVLAFLPETRQRRAAPAVNAPASPAGAGMLAGWRRTLRHPAVTRLVAINLLFTVAFTAMETVFPLFSQEAFGWTAEQNGYIFTYVGVVIVIMQGGLVGQLVKRWGEHALLIAGLVMLAAGLALLPLSTHLALLLVALGILSAGDGAATPSASALLSFASPPGAQGETQGLAQGVGGLGRVIGPLVAGALFTLGAGAPFIAGALLMLLAGLVALPALPGPQQKDAAGARSLPDAASEAARNHREVSPRAQEAPGR
jgi:multidrug resistance protein